ncbi:type IV secretory system conjugative DNA transfer family protein [Psychroserpens algicola]|uniref:Type IV secretion system DNA-binding domain-containing protein n=1 Tax=Psychroserpens algicola TaxID=1719034 RepID=A0ABT0H4V1_9FLAO|nr:type IV secretion system DNA-binding domain-containing protein [Psychroserpens algicola]MCK8479034.1 type IV secretion system DNA-binding domain-containing protein [Psychroserpens algicola]
MKKDNSICYFAESNFREERLTFGIRLHDRLYHFYIIGRTGTGKTTLLKTKISQDLKKGFGLCLIDIHGDLVSQITNLIPEHRLKDIVYLNATDPNLKLGYNPLRKVSIEKQPLVASNILEVFERLWGNKSWGVKLSHILRNVILLLLQQNHATFSDILKVLQDSNFRSLCLKQVTNEEVRNFFEKEFKQYSKNDLVPIYNKLGGLLSYPSVKRILVENTEQLSLRDIMDNNKILLVNLSKGYLGADASNILGSLLLTSISSAAFSRIDTPEEKRPIFFCYLDEFQNYTTTSLVGMLSELRKFKIGLIMAHQYISQLDVNIRDAVLGNVGTIVCFRLGQADARFMEKEFYPVFSASDFVNLSNYDIYLKLMIDGRPSVAFSASTLMPHNIW